MLSFFTSCAHVAGDLDDFQSGGGKNIFGRSEEDVDALETAELKRFFLEPLTADGYLFGDRGILGESVRARSGERLEIRWEGFFPRYRLYYFPSPGHPGAVIGECPFTEGCNSGFFLAPDTDGNGEPDSFRLIQWTSIDYGRDGGVPGYLDRYRYIYDVANDRFYLWHDLLIYSCPPPLSFPPDTCRTICDTPYQTRTVNGRAYPKVFKTRLLESGSLLERSQE